MSPESPDRLLSIHDGPETEEETKGSRFIGQAFAAADDAAALAHVENVRARYPDATHHCWAFRLGPPEAARERCDDDGEPARTAGPPILQALFSAEITDAVLVVTRYYGGTNLGKGGLVRAYGSSARNALAAAPRRETFRLVTLTCHVSYADLGATEIVFSTFADSIVALERDFDPEPRFEITIHASRGPALAESLANATAGRVKIE